jgi:5-methylcytosine-specific restriction endonuclease McrA
LSTGRSTTIRDRDRAAIRRTKPPCGICGGDIDYDLKWPDPWCYVVDHIIPIDSGKTPEERAALDVLSNKQAAHHKCNRDKWDAMPDAGAPRTFVTTRTW